MILTRLPYTLELMGISVLLAIISGVSLGVLSALRHNTLLDYALTTFSLTWISVPSFVLALGLVYVIAVKLHLLPSFGVSSLGIEFNVGDHLTHLILPGFALGSHFMASFVRYSRSAMLEVLHADYMTVARAKGLRERVVIARHGLRNALLPIITITGFYIPALFGGSIIIEQIFQWPGMGMLYITAVNQRDYPVVMGLAFFTALLVLLSNLLVDLAYVFVDPRIRYQ
jgi:peptide/nickel transport system permease protein